MANGNIDTNLVKFGRAVFDRVMRRARLKGGQGAQFSTHFPGPGPQASHQTLHILFSFVMCVCLAFLIFRLL